MPWFSVSIGTWCIFASAALTGLRLIPHLRSILSFAWHTKCYLHPWSFANLMRVQCLESSVDFSCVAADMTALGDACCLLMHQGPKYVEAYIQNQFLKD